MRCLVAATGLVIALASPVFAADSLSGTWTTGGPAPQTFVFKASGDRFGGIACGPCDTAASVFRVEDGRILDASHVSFFVSYDTAGPRFKEFGRYRDRVVGSLADGQLSLSAQPEGRNVPVVDAHVEASRRRVCPGHNERASVKPPHGRSRGSAVTNRGAVGVRRPGRAAERDPEGSRSEDLGRDLRAVRSERRDAHRRWDR